MQLGIKKHACLVIAVVVGGALSCQEPDPNYGDPGGILGRRVPNDPSTASAGSTSSSGGDTSGPFGTATSTPPTITLTAAHAATNGIGPAPADAASRNCLDCHTKTGQAPLKAFSFGGHIVDGTDPAAGAEVIIIFQNTKLGPVQADADGFFWLEGGDLPGGNVFVRKGTKTNNMGGVLVAKTGGGCGALTGCHSGPQGAVHL